MAASEEQHMMSTGNRVTQTF